ncbi:MAG: class I SAM-dependent methyltransferase [Thermoleophilaceae bacterium]|nr:class I SAM-dependent methyltransferase [Thermoleophilaceae bacterium]
MTLQAHPTAEADLPTVVDVYDGFAPFYDEFTSDHDYEAWIGALERLARGHGLAAGRVLDVACGTGKSFLPLLARGYEVVGCDISAEMLARARRKAPGVRLLQADLRALPNVGEFALVTCLDDVLNYLLDPDDLRAAFRSARRNLAPGGLYLFDVNTLKGYRTTWASLSFSGGEKRAYLWRGEASRDAGPGARASVVIEAFTKTAEGAWERTVSRHVQRHHPEPLLRELLRDAGLECLGVYGQLPDGSVEPGADELGHHKAVYVARRPVNHEGERR